MQPALQRKNITILVKKKKKEEKKGKIESKNF